MAVSNVKELAVHRGHRVVVVTYGGDASAAVECETCHEVLVDVDQVVPEAQVGDTVELFLPDHWMLLEVGYSTPSLSLRDGVSGSWFFAVAPGVTDASARFHAVVDAWAADPATMTDAKKAGYPFSYGDAIDRIDPAVWRAAGLVLVRLVANEHLDLDHDDVLVDPTDIEQMS